MISLHAALHANDTDSCRINFHKASSIKCISPTYQRRRWSAHLGFCVLVLLVSFAFFLPAQKVESLQTVAVIGTSPSYREVLNRVITPAGLEGESLGDNPLATSDYKNYRAIIFAERNEKLLNAPEATWETTENLAAVESYLRSGGIIVFCHYGITNVFSKRNAGAAAALLGFESFPDLPEPREISFTSEGKILLKKVDSSGSPTPNWVTGSCPTPSKIGQATILATITSDTKTEPSAIATVNPVGKGNVYYFTPSLHRLIKEKKSEDDIALYASLLQAALATP